MLKVLLGINLAAVLLIATTQVVAERKVNNQCWQTYKQDVNMCRGTVETVDACADQAWDGYMHCTFR